ncbi:hypothetical protein, partial [Streptomyces bikiniensis]|uniref:hypothetical protein n=1 Tax=Streptomyces bikiniensis TaxID=1896 RepID=UPI001ADF7030
QVIRDKISTHPDTLPTKITEHKTHGSSHSETISKSLLRAVGRDATQEGPALWAGPSCVVGY